MEHFFIAFNAVVPFVVYIAYGYTIRRIGVTDEAFMNRLNQVAFKVFFPIQMFNNVYNADFETGFRPVYVAYGVSFLAAVVCASLLIVPHLVPEKPKCSVVIQSVYRSNIILFAVPLAKYVFGDEISSVVMIVAMTVPIYNVLAVVIFEVYRGNRISFFPLIKGILGNPLLQGAIVGGLFLLLRIRLPLALSRPVGELADLTAPLALFILGGTIHFSAFGHYMKYLLPTMLIKMFVLPALAVAVAVWLQLGLTSQEYFGIFCMYAAPVAVASYAMAANMGADGELAAQFVVFSTILSVFSLFFGILGLRLLGLI